MSERAAIVTGGSSGIGLAIARMLAEDGYAVTLSARRPDKLEAATQELQGDGLAVEAVPADVSDEAELQRLLATHRDRHGRLDVLANNAGVGIGGPFGDAATKHVDMQLAVNLRSTYLLTRDALPLLKEAGAEHGKALVVNTASIAGKYGQGFLSAYSATKAGVVGLTQACAKEHAGDGIQFTSLCPGFVATAMTDWIEGEIPKDQMIQPSDVAGAVRYLLSTSSNCFVPEIQFVRAGDQF